MLEFKNLKELMTKISDEKVSQEHMEEDMQSKSQRCYFLKTKFEE